MNKCDFCQHLKDVHGTRFSTACRACLELAKRVSVFAQIFPVCEEFVEPNESRN